MYGTQTVISERYLEAIKRFEGFTPRATPDYGQLSNGYGTKARFEGEVIDRSEAERRFRDEIEVADQLVEKFAPGLPDGAKAALTSLTYNAGTKWMHAGLGESVKRGDIVTASSILTEYTKAGGKVLPGLQTRRRDEAQWMKQAALEPASDASSGAFSSTVETLPLSFKHQRSETASTGLPLVKNRGHVQLDKTLTVRFAAIEYLIHTVLQNVHPVANDKEKEG